MKQAGVSYLSYWLRLQSDIWWRKFNLHLQTPTTYMKNIMNLHGDWSRCLRYRHLINRWTPPNIKIKSQVWILEQAAVFRAGWEALRSRINKYDGGLFFIMTVKGMPLRTFYHQGARYSDNWAGDLPRNINSALASVIIIMLMWMIADIYQHRR